jgi:hypothetical protein
MSKDSGSSEKWRSQVAIFQNPYRFLELEEESLGGVPNEPTFEQKQAYFSRLQNPHAYQDIFGEIEKEPSLNESPARASQNPRSTVETNLASGGVGISRAHLEKSLLEVLGLFKPYVARKDWAQVMDYRSEFLDDASRTPARAKRVFDRLKELRFSLMPGERVEHNRAPAARIISELKRLLE